MSQDWTEQKERSNNLALQTIVWITRHIGRWAGRLLLYPITAYYLLTSRQVCRASRQFLDRALNRPATYWDTARHLHCFASTILDRVFLFSGQYDVFNVNVHNRQVLDRYADNHQGCLLLASHLGSFEIMRIMGLDTENLPIMIVMQRNHNEKLTKILESLNPGLRKSIIDTSSNGLAVLEIKEALENGNMVSVMADRAHNDNDRLVPCDFMGGTVNLPASPYLIASAMKVPVVMCFGLYRGKGQYDIHFELLTENLALPRKERVQYLSGWAQQYANRLAHYSRLAPYNWFNFYDFWQKKTETKSA